MDRLKELESDLKWVIEQRERIDENIKMYKDKIEHYQQMIEFSARSDYNYYIQEKEILTEIKNIECEI